MADEAKIGLALLGAGEHVRRNILPALAACPEVAIRGLYTLGDEAQAIANEWKTRAYAGVEELLADTSVTAVYVGAWTGEHANLGRRVLGAGKHLWCEKSLCTNWQDWQHLVELGQSKKLSVFECFMFPFHPQFQKLQQHMVAGTLGTIRSVTARFGFPHLPAQNFRYQKARGGGALLDAGAYPLCAARLLLGPLDAVHSILDQEPPHEIDTAGSALLRSAGGTHAHLEWGFGRAYRNEIEVWGEQGTVYLDRAFSKPANLATSLRFAMQDGRKFEESVEPANHFTIMFGAFARAVRSGEIQEFSQRTLEQGLLLHEVLTHAGRC